MEFEGKFTVRASLDKVWKTFMDPNKLKDCMPDLQLLEVFGEDHYRTVVKVGVSFIKGKFDFDVNVVEKQEPTHARFRAHGKGRGSGVDVDSTIDLAETSGGTEMTWHADAKVVGTLASVGSRVLRSTAEKRVNEFFDCVRVLLEEGHPSLDRGHRKRGEPG
ncbi:MAG: CoxG family protein [Thermoplasmata archaeon]